jgi:hypothetical protein
MKIEVVVDPSRLASAPSLASRVAPAESTAIVTEGTQAVRSVGVVTLQVLRGDLTDAFIRITGAVVHLVVAAEGQVLARPRDHRSLPKISMPRWRLVMNSLDLIELC